MLETELTNGRAFLYGVIYKKKVLTFCWRHSLHARFTAVLRRDDDEGRVSPSPFSSSSLDAERLKPRVCVLLGLWNGCGRPGSPGVVGDMECSILLDISDRYRREFRL